VARAQGISPVLLGRWKRQALEQAVLSSTERAESKRLRAELKRVEIERDILKKAVTIGMLEPHYHSTNR
jgi:transposase